MAEKRDLAVFKVYIRIERLEKKKRANKIVLCSVLYKFYEHAKFTRKRKQMNLPSLAIPFNKYAWNLL